MTLKDKGFAVGDLVTFNSDKEATGGIVYSIAVNIDPVTPVTTQREGTRMGWAYDERTRQSKQVPEKYMQRVALDENGKDIPPMELAGIVRLKPIFDFFPSSRGKKPKGKGGTVLVYHSEIDQAMKKIDIAALGSKYLELGNVIRALATKEGFEVKFEDTL